MEILRSWLCFFLMLPFYFPTYFLFFSPKMPWNHVKEPSLYVGGIRKFVPIFFDMQFFDMKKKRI